MLLTRARYDFVTVDDRPLDQDTIMVFLERIGRVCYKSEDRISAGSAAKFCKMILGSGHESVIEHFSFTVKFTTDRGVSHELVRHRLAAYSQESTRYCDYGKKGIVYIIPGDIDLPSGQCQVYMYNPLDIGAGYGLKYVSGKLVKLPPDVADWALGLEFAENTYNKLRGHGWQPQKARGVLPNNLKTEIVATYNLRQWRHVLKERTMEKCHPQMKELTIPLLAKLKETLPVFFGDIC